jgi:hypothetical protein
MCTRSDDIARLSELTGISDKTVIEALLDEAGSIEAATEIYISNLKALTDLEAKRTPVRSAPSSHATPGPTPGDLIIIII